MAIAFLTNLYGKNILVQATILSISVISTFFEIQKIKRRINAPFNFILSFKTKVHLPH